MNLENKFKVLMALQDHRGRANAIGMVELHTKVFGEEPASRVNGCRRVRELVVELQREGAPICSTTVTGSAGYYLSQTGEELVGQCDKLVQKALKVLKRAANMRKISLPELLGQLSMTADAP